MDKKVQEWIEDSRLQGWNEGVTRGIEEGRTQGIAIGMQRARVQTALILERMELPIEDIAEAVSTPVEEVRGWLAGNE